jgi:hypothetical protein
MAKDDEADVPLGCVLPPGRYVWDAASGKIRPAPNPSSPPEVNTTGGFLDSFFAAGGNLDPAVLAEIDAILNPPIISTALH